MSIAEPGKRYRHYKGKEYTVLALAWHTETFEELVVYQAEYDVPDLINRPVWVRPLKMFEGQVEIDGKPRDRFTKI